MNKNVAPLFNKLLVSMLLVAGASAAQANGGRPLNDLNSVVGALDAGVRVAVTIDLSLCQPQAGGQPSQTKGGLAGIDAYRVLADSTLMFSDAHFTVTDAGSPVFQSLRYRVTSDGAVAFRSTTMSLPNYTVINQSTFTCAIGNGVNFKAILR